MGSGKNDEREDFETNTISLPRLDAFIMTFSTCRTDSDIRGVHRKRLYIETFSKYLPIDMDWICGSLYPYVQKWEPEDLDGS